MSNLVDVITQTRLAITGNLPVTMSLDRVEWPNEAWNTPNEQPWMRVTWNNIGLISRDASHCYEINAGILTVDFFYPKFQVIIPAVADAEFLKKALLETVYNDVVINGANITNPGNSGSWYQVQLNIDYQYEGYVNA